MITKIKESLMRKLNLKAVTDPLRIAPVQQPEPKIILRPADIHDILPLTLMWSRMIQEVFDNLIILNKVELDKFSFAMADRLRMPNIFTQVAVDGARVVGFIHAYMQERAYGQPNKIAFCECLYIEPEYRGKGINKQLVKSFIDWAKANGLAIEFMTKYDPELVKVWERDGFKPLTIIFRRS